MSSNESFCNAHILDQYYVGYCYLNGIGVEQNIENALKYLTLSAEKDCSISQVALGDYYKYTIKDYEKAIHWYNKASIQNIASADFHLGDIYFQQGIYTKAITHLLKAAEKNIPYAFYYLGICYCNGNGLMADMQKSIDLFTLASNHNLGIAHNILGSCYEYGICVSKNMKKAVYYYELAANNHIYIAQLKVSHCYKDGIGVKQNKILASYWLKLAKNNKHDHVLEVKNKMFLFANYEVLEQITNSLLGSMYNFNSSLIYYYKNNLIQELYTFMQNVSKDYNDKHSNLSYMFKKLQQIIKKIDV